MTVPLWVLLAALSIIGFLIGTWMHSINGHLRSMDDKMSNFLERTATSEGTLLDHERRITDNENRIFDLQKNI